MPDWGRLLGQGNGEQRDCAGGWPASVRAEMELRIVQATLQEEPANVAHWSTRTLAVQASSCTTTSA